VAGVGVQQFPLHRFAQQGLVGMLAVYVDQQGPQVYAILQGGGITIDVGATASLVGDDPAQQAFFTDVQVPFPEPGCRGGYGPHVETGDNLGAITAGAHRLGVSPVSQAKSQGIQHDGLPGARLAGNDSHAGRELHLQVGDDGVVADTDMDEHGRP
jgi:hypothetical protein